MPDRGTMDGAPSGLVRIKASPALSNGFLTSRLAKLAACYPRLDIDLAPNHRFISLKRHGDVVARPLATVGYGFYGTEGACRSVEAGADPVLIGFDEVDA